MTVLHPTEEELRAERRRLLDRLSTIEWLLYGDLPQDDPVLNRLVDLDDSERHPRLSRALLKIDRVRRAMFGRLP